MPKSPDSLPPEREFAYLLRAEAEIRQIGESALGLYAQETVEGAEWLLEEDDKRNASAASTITTAESYANTHSTVDQDIIELTNQENMREDLRRVSQTMNASYYRTLLQKPTYGVARGTFNEAKNPADKTDPEESARIAEANRVSMNRLKWASGSAAPIESQVDQRGDDD